MAKHRVEVPHSGNQGDVVVGDETSELTTNDIGVHWDDAEITNREQLAFHVELLKNYLTQDPGTVGTTEQWRMGIDRGAAFSAIAETDSFDSPTYTALAEDVAVEFKTASFGVSDINHVIDHIDIIMQGVEQLDFQPA